MSHALESGVKFSETWKMICKMMWTLLSLNKIQLYGMINSLKGLGIVFVAWAWITFKLSIYLQGCQKLVVKISIIAKNSEKMFSF